MTPLSLVEIFRLVWVDSHTFIQALCTSLSQSRHRLVKVEPPWTYYYFLEQTILPGLVNRSLQTRKEYLKEVFGCCTECIKLVVGLCGVCWISVVRIFVGHLPAEQYIPSAQSACLHCEVPFQWVFSYQLPTTLQLVYTVSKSTLYSE